MENNVKTKKFSKISALAIFIIVGVVFAFLFERVYYQEVFNLDRVKKVSNLHSLTCSFKNVAVEEIQSWRGVEKCFIEYTATVDIGISLKELEYDKNTKTITIPKAKVLSKNYDPDSIKTYQSTFVIFSGINDQVTTKLLSNSLDNLVKEVEENETIMIKAQNIASNQIDNLIKNLYSVPQLNTGFNYVLK